MLRNPGSDPFFRACRMYALHCGLLPLNTSSPLSVTTCHISAPPLLYLSRAAGLSRLSCVRPFPHCHRFYPCGGRAPYTRPGAGCLLAVPPIDALPAYAVSFRGESPPAGMVAGFRPPRPRLSGVPAWEKGEYPGDRNRTGLQLERVQSNAPAGGLQTASRPRWDAALFATRLRGAALRIQPGGSRTFSHATLCRHPRSPGSTPQLCGLVPGRRRGSPLLQIPLAYPHRSRQKLRR